MSRTYTCDLGECPYSASIAMNCRDLCGLGVDESVVDFDEYADEEWDEYEDFDEQPSLWVKFLGERFGCYPDAVGNMPCDNGHVCDKCHYADTEFQQFKIRKKSCSP